jgi:hypothetical protein
MVITKFLNDSSAVQKKTSSTERGRTNPEPDESSLHLCIFHFFNTDFDQKRVSLLLSVHRATNSDLLGVVGLHLEEI